MCKNIKNIGVLISGSGSNLQAIIDKCQDGTIQGRVKVVISNRKDAYGLERARKHNIKDIYLSVKNLLAEEYDKELLKILKDEEIDLLVLAGYLKILGENVIKSYENKIINIHPSLIPSFCGKGYYGLKVHEKALEYGVKVSGATTHFVTLDPDQGPIIFQRCVNIEDDDTPTSLQSRILEVEHEILVESVREFCRDNLQVVGRKVSKIR